LNLNKLVFFNTGWMKRYEGLAADDPLIGGGAFVNENGFGGEMWNFHRSDDGYVYGFVEPGLRDGNQKSIHVEKLGGAASDDRVDDVTVVWTAKRPQGGVCVVGWYFHATVFRQSIRDPSRGSGSLGRDSQNVTQLYNVKAKAEDAVLLPEEERDLNVPRGKGGFGQSNIWYAKDNQEFVEEVKDYIRQKTDARRQ